jgi:nicotinamide phosphoribosyltransferase
MCAGGAEDEIETFRRILKAYPTGVVSIVSDTWDLWHVCTNILPRLKDEIMARDGKVVIRPDSGNPADIICGFKGDCYQDEDGKWLMLEGDIEYPETVIKGVVELLYEVFGGTTSDEGYKVLDPHIGVIYGDSITITIAQDILERLEVKGFAATNVVLGIGSYTYQFNTRDSFGFAMKATNVTIKGVDTPIFKDPITDSGTKKSAKGLLCVGNDEDGTYKLIDQVSRRSSEIGWLRVIYQDGIFHNTEKLEQIKNRVSTNINNYAKPA